MSTIKILNINGVDYDVAGSTGGAGGIFPEEYITDHKFYVKCKEGDILETDTLKFARYGKFKHHFNDSDEINYRKVSKGWVTPILKCIPSEYKTHILLPELHFAFNKDGYDYWELTMYNGESIVEYYNTFLEETPSNYWINVSRKCGVAIVREGSQISRYLHFTIGSDKNADIHSGFAIW